MRSPRPILLRIGSRLGGRRGSGSENRVRYVHLLARRGRERAAVPRKQINAPRSNINSIIETKRAGGVAGRSLLARRGCSGGTWLPRRMRVDVSAGLRRMNEGRRVMLPRYCTARHERTSKGRGRGGWLPVPPPRFLPTPRHTTVRSFAQTASRKLRCRCCIMCQPGTEAP